MASVTSNAPVWPALLVWAAAMGMQAPLAAQDQAAPAPTSDSAPAQQPTSQSPSSGISCVLRDGVPTTVSQTRRGEVPIIRWTSSDFDASGWTPDRRCQVVSQRFETFRLSGQLRYLTTGRVGGQNVICAVPTQESPCASTDVLYTLKAGQDPGETLARLLNVRRGASGPIPETSSRLYVDFDRLIEDKLAVSQPATPAKTTTKPSSKASGKTKPGASTKTQPAGASPDGVHW